MGFKESILFHFIYHMRAVGVYNCRPFMTHILLFRDKNLMPYDWKTKRLHCYEFKKKETERNSCMAFFLKMHYVPASFAPASYLHSVRAFNVNNKSDCNQLRASMSTKEKYFVASNLFVCVSRVSIALKWLDTNG